MAEWIKVVLLGIVQGITEFLPISSTGHLIVTSRFFALSDDIAGTFEIFIQIGAVFAVVIHYFPSLWQQLIDLIRLFSRGTDNDDEEQQARSQQTLRLWIGVFFAFIPAAAIGLLIDDFITAVLFSPTVVAWALIAGGILFIVVDSPWFQREERKRIEASNVYDQPLTWRQAITVGLWQVLALIPGMSRSGMSIIGGMLAGLDRNRATEFSFYLALPTLTAATLYTLASDFSTIPTDSLWLLALGTVVSTLVAWASIGWLLRYVSSNNFVPFGIYRIVVGVIILVIVATASG